MFSLVDFLHNDKLFNIIHNYILVFIIYDYLFLKNLFIWLYQVLAATLRIFVKSWWIFCDTAGAHGLPSCSLQA